jgi:hypothetical protein
MMPYITPSNMILNALYEYFCVIEDQCGVIDSVVSGVDNLVSAERYITMHGLNRAAVNTFSESLESFGIEVRPDSYTITLNSINEKLASIQSDISTSLENIASCDTASNTVELWVAGIEYLCKKAAKSYSVVDKSSFNMNFDKKMIGTTPAAFETHAKHVATVAAFINTRSFDLSKPIDADILQSVESLKNAVYRYDTLENMSWSVDAVRKASSCIKNQVIPTTLKLDKLVNKLQQSCESLSKDFDSAKYQILKQYCDAIRCTAEVTMRMLTQYTDMI